jgi:hypothetical protein
MAKIRTDCDWGGVEPSAIRFGIVIQELGEALACGKGDRCLDLTTGAVVPAANCPDQETGEGRPALRQGKRFVRVPAFDELHQELKQQLDNAEAEQDQEELLASELGGKENDFLGWCDFLRGEEAQQQAALRWVANLRPDFKIAMVDELDDEPLYVYDPERGDWVDLCE